MIKFLLSARLVTTVDLLCILWLIVDIYLMSVRRINDYKKALWSGQHPTAAQYIAKWRDFSGYALAALAAAMVAVALVGFFVNHAVIFPILGWILLVVALVTRWAMRRYVAFLQAQGNDYWKAVHAADKAAGKQEYQPRA